MDPYYDVNKHNDYGYNGMIPIVYSFAGQYNKFLQTMEDLVNTILGEFSYPTNVVDTDDPNIAHLGGLFFPAFSMIDQHGYIIPPLENDYVSASKYSQQRYGDDGIVYPPEFARLGLHGLMPYQRASSADTYLYPALNRSNLTIISEALVTKLIINDSTVKGMKYLEGWNIYQT